jgi:hypothetical protein
VNHLKFQNIAALKTELHCVVYLKYSKIVNCRIKLRFFVLKKRQKRQVTLVSFYWFDFLFKKNFIFLNETLKKKEI